MLPVSDKTISVIDPTSETELARFSLQQDPTPEIVHRAFDRYFAETMPGNINK